MMDFVSDDKIKTPEFIAEQNALQDEVFACMSQCLSPKEMQVIQMRYGMQPYQESMTLEKIGEFFGITRERVRQIEMNAMHKLRNPKYKKNLKVFLEA